MPINFGIGGKKKDKKSIDRKRGKNNVKGF